MLRMVVALAVALVLSHQATAGGMPALDSEYEGNLVFAGIDVSLPPGKWVVAVVEESRSTSSLVGKTIGNLVLARLEGRRAVGFVVARANFDPSPNGWQPDGDCERKDVLHIAKNANYDGREQDCWMVNHRRMAFNGKAAPWQQKWQDWWIGLKVAVPPTMLYHKHRFANRMWFAEIQYHVDPEAAGFAPATQDWAANDWHRGRSGADPVRTAYVATLAADAEALHERLGRSFSAR